jgi:hypothetical protein
MLLMFVVFILPLQVNGVCYENTLFVCPISDRTKIFTVDRWNYNHDEYFQIVKDNATPETIIASRSIYDFYIEKYELHNNTLMRLSEPTKQYVRDWSKFSISDLSEKDVILIDYPQIVYYENLNSPYDHIYDYLLNQRKNKTVLYRSSDNKVVVYQFKKES